MTNLITEARELCGSIVKRDTFLGHGDQKYVFSALIPELCDALEKAQAYNAQLVRELSALARESIEREKVLAKLEAEVMAVTEPKRGEWKNVYKSGYKPNPENVCSECDCWSHRRSDYCPNCGAKMEDKPCE